MSPRFKLFAYPAIAGAIVLLLWVLLRWALDVSTFVIPYPWEIIAAGISEADSLHSAIVGTGTKALGGFALAATVGFALAFLMAATPVIRASLYPYILVLQMTPVIVLIPVIQNIFGPYRTDLSVVTVTFIVSFFPIVANTTRGLLSTDRNLLELFRLYGATRWQELSRLRLPFALPYFFTGLTIAAAVALAGAIFAELFVGTGTNDGGLGQLIRFYSSQGRTPEVFAAGLVSCLLGFALVLAVSAANWLFLRHWHESAQSPTATS